MRAAFPHKFGADVFSEYKLQFQKNFFNVCASKKKISLFQNPFNWDTEELPPNLQLKVIVLQGKDMLKGKYIKRRI